MNDLVKPDNLPIIKTLSIAETRQEIRDYRALQKILDEEMPDQIMTIGGKKFRKKGYWRAIKKRAQINCQFIEEKRIVTDNDWGYAVTYRATAPTGQFEDGDGTCMASEKSRGQMKPTEHNVRSHAHTRAKNRAISDLVGFGEVTAEEIIEEHQRPESPKPEPSKKEQNITPKQFGELTDTIAQIKAADPTFDDARFVTEYCKKDRLEDLHTSSFASVKVRLNDRLEKAKTIAAFADDKNAHTQQEEDYSRQVPFEPLDHNG